MKSSYTFHPLDTVLKLEWIIFVRSWWQSCRNRDRRSGISSTVSRSWESLRFKRNTQVSWRRKMFYHRSWSWSLATCGRELWSNTPPFPVDICQRTFLIDQDIFWWINPELRALQFSVGLVLARRPLTYISGLKIYSAAAVWFFEIGVTVIF